MDEQAFLRTILAHPGDDAPRLIYADWLADQGDERSLAKSEYLRFLCDPDRPPGPRVLQDETFRKLLHPDWQPGKQDKTAAREVELLQRGSKFEGEWIAAVGKMRIYNCRQRRKKITLSLSFNLTLAFRHVCRRSWQDLQASEADVRRRHCDRCGKGVFYCETDGEMEDHSGAGDCLALNPPAIDLRRFIEPSRRRMREGTAPTRRPRTETD